MKIQHLILTATTALFVGKAIAGTAGNADVADSCGTGCSYTISADGKTLTITGTGENASVSNYAFTPDYDAGGNEVSGNNMDFRFSSVKNVVVTGTISQVGYSAFQNNALESVIIPDSVTKIGSAAFYGNNLTSVTIPSSLIRIGWGAFYQNNLTSVNIPSSVTEIGEAAFTGNNLTAVTIPSSVTSIGKWAFSSNDYLSSVMIEGSPEIKEDAFKDIASSAVVYCLTGHTACDNKGANVTYYSKDGDLYTIEDANHNVTYFASADLMVNGVGCTDKSQCLNLVAAAAQGAFMFGGKSYASLADLAKGNNMPKRIYTIEEAEAAVKFPYSL